jgi:hypothetical protein
MTPPDAAKGSVKLKKRAATPAALTGGNTALEPYSTSTLYPVAGFRA